MIFLLSISSINSKLEKKQQPNNQSNSQQKNPLCSKDFTIFQVQPPVDCDVLFVLRKTEKMRIWYVNWVDPNQQKHFKFSLLRSKITTLPVCWIKQKLVFNFFGGCGEKKENNKWNNIKLICWVNWATWIRIHSYFCLAQLILQPAKNCRNKHL